MAHIDKADLLVDLQEPAHRVMIRADPSRVTGLLQQFAVHDPIRVLASIPTSNKQIARSTTRKQRAKLACLEYNSSHRA